MLGKIAPIIVLMVLALGVTTSAAGTVTLYSQGIACIDETQTITLNKGTNTVRISVPSGFVPDSLTIEFNGEVISQSFHAGTADSVLAAAIGKKIEVVGKDGTVYRGILISTAGEIVLREENGTIDLISNPSRISISGKDIELSPYLELVLSAAASGKEPLRLTYLSTGFNWAMSYVGTLSADGKALSLTGWARLENNTDYSLSGMSVQLVAGQVNQVEKSYSGMRVAAMAAPPLPEENAFEYHLYTLPVPIDLPAGKTVLIPYGTYSGIPVKKIYTFKGSGVEVSLQFRNDTDNGLGVPLPAGDVRLFQARSDGTIFIGADSIGHTPIGTEVSLAAGSAFDLTGKRTELSNVKLSGSTYRASYRIELRNHKDEAVTVNVLERPAGKSWKVITSSQSYTRVDSGTIKFVVNVPANGESEVTYTVEYSY